MAWTRLEGTRYVRLAPGAAEALAPFVDMEPEQIDELVLDLKAWPEEIRPAARRARDGRLLEGDPVLMGSNEDGLIFSAGTTPQGHPVGTGILVRWDTVGSLRVLARR